MPAEARERAAVTATCLILALLVLRAAAAGLLDAGGPAGPARLLAPGSAPALVERARRGGPEAAALLRRAALLAPLRPEPFLALALAEGRAGRWPAAIRAGEAARAREPRALAVRGALLAAYLHAGRAGAAVGELDAILSRGGPADEPALRLLLLLADDPGGRPAVAAALATGPRWRTAFLDRAGATGAARALVLRALVRGSGKGGDGKGGDGKGGGGEGGALLRGLADAGDYGRAYLAWVELLTPAQAASVRPVFDGAFRDGAPPPPFNWTLRRDGEAAAERARGVPVPGGTALAVDYAGRVPAEIADELLMLPPGRYAFAAVVGGGEGGATAPVLRWTLACLPAGPAMPLAAVGRVPARPTALHGEAVLPAAGCAAQRLSLAGEPGEVPAPVRALFTGVRLDPR